MAGVASAGEAILNPGTGKTSESLDVSSFEKMGNITSDHSLISVSGEGAGNIFIRGGEFLLDNYSSVEADTGDEDAGIIDIRANMLLLNHESSIFSDARGKGRGGSIILDIAESVNISDFSKVFANAAGYGSDAGDAGTVLIETKKLSLSDGGAISSQTYGGGKGGSVTLRAGESASISGDRSIVFANALGKDPDAGHGGTILIETNRLSLSDKAVISSETYDGGGRGGNITISGYNGEFAESVDVFDSGRIYGGAIDGEVENAGHGGDIEIKAGNISLTDGGIIGSESAGTGKGGDVRIIASESVRFSGEGEYGPSKVYTSALSEDENAGDAGDILVRSGNILFQNSGGVTASTKGPGSAGIIELKAARLDMDRGSVSSASESGGKGGDAGRIDIIAEEAARLENHSSITTETAGQGNAGDISLKTCRLELDSDSSVSSESASHSDNAGNAGTITIDSCDLILENNSSVTTEAQGAGGGKIFVKAENRLYLFDSDITSSVKQGEGRGGDVTVGSLLPEGKKEGAKFVILNQGNITANADIGDGGAIFIITDNYIKSEDSKVTATSRRGNDGTVRIEAPDMDVSSGLVVLPDNYIDAARWIKKPCSARAGEKASRFVVKGRDAASTSSDDLQPGLRFWFGKTESGGDSERKGYLESLKDNSGKDNSGELISKGEEYFQKGDYGHAARTWERAITIPDAKKETGTYLDTVVHLAGAYQALGYHDRALKVLDSALPIAEKSKDQYHNAQFFSSLGDIHLSLGNSDMADKYLAKGLEQARLAENPRVLTAVMTDVGNLLAADGDYEGATAAYTECLNIADQLKENPELKSKALVNLLYVTHKGGNDQDIEAATDEALAEIGNLPEHFSIIFSDLFRVKTQKSSA